MGRGTGAPRMGIAAAVPPLGQRLAVSMDDMGMAGMGTGMGEMAGMNHGAMGGMDHGSMSMRDPANAPPDMKVGVGVDMVAAMPQDRTGHPGLGMENVGHRVLTYRDLVALTPNRDPPPPPHDMEIHLTATLDRFIRPFAHPP